MNIRLILSALAASAALCATPGTFGAQIFVVNFQTGTIGEYTISGETVNASLISGLNQPTDIVVVPSSVADASSTWALLLLALIATFGLKPLLHRPA